MKKILQIMLVLTLVMAVAVGCGSKKEKETSDTGSKVTESNSPEVTDEATEAPTEDTSGEEQEPGGETTKNTDKSEAQSGKHHVTIEVQDYGTISVELDGDVAPETVTNFITLAKEGFYDGLTFHRIISGFMIQGGDPNGDGTGGSDKNIKGEFANNGVENNISHVRGTISMARAQDYDSASSQFFIMHQDYTGLDGDYAAFGHVTDGMDVVDKICEKVPVTDSNGTVESDKQPVITKITVVD